MAYRKGEIMGMFLDNVRVVKKLHKIYKHMKKNSALEKYFNDYLSEKYTPDTNELKKLMKNDVSIIYDMIRHYDEIKGKFK